MEIVYHFIEECCERYTIDESHGLRHAKDTVAWAEKLIAEEGVVDPVERRMILWSAALHDMCDAKYTNPVEAAEDIRKWLIACKWSAFEAETLIRIILSTSYSKLKTQWKATGECPYPDHGIFTRAYHIVRHADLLEGYSVRRCMLYTRHRLPGKTEEDYWTLVKEVFHNRVLQYVTDGWLFLPAAIRYAVELDKIARIDLEREAWTA